jgi:inosine-uridine nucleoside N-ribohydrolase
MTRTRDVPLGDVVPPPGPWSRAPLLVDCDPGIDHVLSLIYGAHHFDLVQVTTSHGNAPVATTTTNALRVLDRLGLDVPVAPGCSRAIVEPAHPAALFHGTDGLAGVDLPPARRPPEARHAVDAIIETAGALRGELVVACLGPLTNLALALRREPRLPEWIRLVTIMGGAAAGVGHMTPVAEFNFWSDPEAADIVCCSGLRKRIVGYDVTRTIGLTAEDLAGLARAGGVASVLVSGLYRPYLDRQREVWGLPYAPAHSALTLVPLVRPDLVTSAEGRVAVELDGRLTRGMSVYDTRTVASREPAPSFEYLPRSGAVTRTTSVSPQTVGHVLDTVLAVDGSGD